MESLTPQVSATQSDLFYTFPATTRAATKFSNSVDHECL